jgi:hypothetical protein
MRQDEPPTLPPRPNRGPEPWPEEDQISPWWWLAVTPIIPLFAWWIARRYRVGLANKPAAPATPQEEIASASERLIRIAETVREALTRQFGPAWAAMTTEEIADAMARIEILAPSSRESAVSLLSASDRAKFAGREVDGDHLAAAEAWAAGVLEALGAAGARSIQSGR